MVHRLQSKQYIYIGLLVFAFVLIASTAWAGPWTDALCTPVDAIKDYDDCWTCTIMLIFFDASNSLAGHVEAILSGPAKTILTVGLALWLAFNTAIFFSSVADTPDLGAFATKVGGMMLRGVIAVIFLSVGTGSAFDYFVNPLIESSAKLGTQLSALGTQLGKKPAGELGGETKYTQVGTGPISNSTRDALKELVGSLSSGLKELQKTASAMRCGALEGNKSDWKQEFVGFDQYYISITMWLWGCALGCMLWAIALIFPMTLMDAIFRLGLMISIVPAFVVAWVFPATRHFSKTAFTIILHTCLMFVVTAIVMNICVAMISMSAGFEPEFFKKMQEGKYDEANEILDRTESFLGFVITMCVCLFSILMAPKAEKIAAHFSGGEFPDSCGMKALMYTIELIISIVMLIITILTAGMGAILFIAKIAHWSTKVVKIIQKIQKIMKKVKELAEKTKKLAKRGTSAMK